MLLALAAGVSLTLAFEPLAWWFLVPFAVTGFALTTRGLTAPRAGLVGLVFGVGFYFTHVYWMRAVGTDAWLALSSIESLFYAPLGSVFAVLARRRLWPLWLAAAWVAMETIRSSWPFSGMPWGRLAFPPIDTPLQTALPYVGTTGVSFVLALAGVLIAAAVVTGPTGRRAAVSSLAGLAALVLLVLLTALAPYTPSTQGQTTVAAVQGDVPGAGDDILSDFRQVTANHVDATVELAAEVEAGRAPRPDFVVWPENSTAVDPFLDTETNQGIEAASDAIGVPILVGAIVDSGPTRVLNQSIVWEPDTGGGDRYTKWHPVPYGEYIPFRSVFQGTFGKLALIPRDMMSGTRTDPLRIAGVEVAAAICFDVAYDDGLYAQIERGAQLVAVQTSNALFIRTSQIDQQFAISRVRAVETGRVVVVAATNGVSGIIAPDGRVLSRADIRTQKVMVEQVGLTTSIPPAVRLGPWWGRGSVAVTVLGLVLGLVPYRRKRQQRESTAAAVPTLDTVPEH